MEPTNLVTFYAHFETIFAVLSIIFHVHISGSNQASTIFMVMTTKAICGECEVCKGFIICPHPLRAVVAGETKFFYSKLTAVAGCSNHCAFFILGCVRHVVDDFACRACKNHRKCHDKAKCQDADSCDFDCVQFDTSHNSPLKLNEHCEFTKCWDNLVGFLVTFHPCLVALSHTYTHAYTKLYKNMIYFFT